MTCELCEFVFKYNEKNPHDEIEILLHECGKIRLITAKDNQWINEVSWIEKGKKFKRPFCFFRGAAIEFYNQKLNELKEINYV